MKFIPPLFSNAVNLHLFIYSQSEFGTSINFLYAIIDTSQFHLSFYLGLKFIFGFGVYN